MRFFSIAPSVLPGTRRRPHAAPASELSPGPPTMAACRVGADQLGTLLGPDTIAAEGAIKVEVVVRDRCKEPGSPSRSGPRVPPMPRQPRRMPLPSSPGRTSPVDERSGCRVTVDEYSVALRSRLLLPTTITDPQNVTALDCRSCSDVQQSTG
jgi:hypothetical protein